MPGELRIISASRREDMPAFRPFEIARRFFAPAYADCFWMLWTKDPRRLVELGLDWRRVALQLTVTGLGGGELEPGVPEPGLVWSAVRKLVTAGLDPRLINWRLDPILAGEHTPALVTGLAKQAAGLGISRCTISFPTFYPAVQARWPAWQRCELKPATQAVVAARIRDALAPHGITVYGCAQPHLAGSVTPSACIDGAWLASVTGLDFATGKDQWQRNACGCSASRDIGAYRPCAHGCLYCYARPELDPSAGERQLELELQPEAP